MVCIRCIMVVKAELETLGLRWGSVVLGEVELVDRLSSQQLDELDIALRLSGLELMNDKKSMLIEKIKNCIVEVVHYSDSQLKVNLSDYLSETLNYDYTYLSTLFSESKGVTIEQFFIAHRIERVKELLVYDELTLTEIAYKLNYSSVSHLSNQFKKVTGLTPTYFKKLRHKRRVLLENVGKM